MLLMSFQRPSGGKNCIFPDQFGSPKSTPSVWTYPRRRTGHVRRPIASEMVIVVNIGVGEQISDFWGHSRQLVLVPWWPLLTGSTPSGTVRVRYHFAILIATVGKVTMEDSVVDQNGRACLGKNHQLVRVVEVTFVRAPFRVEAEVRIRDDAERRTFGRQFI